MDFTDVNCRLLLCKKRKSLPFRGGGAAFAAPEGYKGIDFVPLSQKSQIFAGYPERGALAAAQPTKLQFTPFCGACCWFT